MGRFIHHGPQEHFLDANGMTVVLQNGEMFDTAGRQLPPDPELLAAKGYAVTGQARLRLEQAQLVRQMEDKLEAQRRENEAQLREMKNAFQADADARSLEFLRQQRALVPQVNPDTGRPAPQPFTQAELDYHLNNPRVVEAYPHQAAPHLLGIPGIPGGPYNMPTPPFPARDTSRPGHLNSDDNADLFDATPVAPRFGPVPVAAPAPMLNPPQPPALPELPPLPPPVAG